MGVARVLGKKALNFERLLILFVEMISRYVYEYLVESTAKLYSMQKQTEGRELSQTYKDARCATDVTFQ